MVASVRKIIASLLLCVFTITTLPVSYTYPQVSSTHGTVPTSQEKKIALLNPQSLDIPMNLGVKEDSFIAPGFMDNPRTIIHIKDLHCQYDAQMTIAELIKHLATSYGIKDILVEGATGEVDTRLFGAFPDKKVLEKVAKEFVKKGIVTGPEYLSMVEFGKMPIAIEGLEDASLYIRNLKAFRDVFGREGDTNRFMEVAGEVIEKLQEKVYNPELLLFRVEERKVSDKEVGFSEYANFLGGLLERKGFGVTRWKNFEVLIEVVKEQQKIDIEKVEKERNEIITHLTKVLVKEEVEEVVKRSLYFRLKKESALDYFTYIEGLYKEYCKGMECQELEKYFKLVKRQGKIEWVKLLWEVREVKEELRRVLVKSKKEQEVEKASEVIVKLGKLFQLELNREELLYFKEHRGEFDIERIAGRLRELCQEEGIGVDTLLENYSYLEELNELLRYGEEFYISAIERDDAMVAKAMEIMEEGGVDKAIVMAGGFHSKGMMERFKEQGVSYVVVVPKIGEISEDNPYHELMMDERIVFEERRVAKHLEILETKGEEAVYEALALASRFSDLLDNINSDLKSNETQNIIYELLTVLNLDENALDAFIEKWILYEGSKFSFKQIDNLVAVIKSIDEASLFSIIQRLIDNDIALQLVKEGISEEDQARIANKLISLFKKIKGAKLDNIEKEKEKIKDFIIRNLANESSEVQLLLSDTREALNGKTISEGMLAKMVGIMMYPGLGVSFLTLLEEARGTKGEAQAQEALDNALSKVKEYAKAMSSFKERSSRNLEEYRKELLEALIASSENSPFTQGERRSVSLFFSDEWTLEAQLIDAMQYSPTDIEWSSDAGTIFFKPNKIFLSQEYTADELEKIRSVLEELGVTIGFYHKVLHEYGAITPKSVEWEIREAQAVGAGYILCHLTDTDKSQEEVVNSGIRLANANKVRQLPELTLNIENNPGIVAERFIERVEKIYEAIARTLKGDGWSDSDIKKFLRINLTIDSSHLEISGKRQFSAELQLIGIIRSLRELNSRLGTNITISHSHLANLYGSGIIQPKPGFPTDDNHFRLSDRAGIINTDLFIRIFAAFGMRPILVVEQMDAMNEQDQEIIDYSSKPREAFVAVAQDREGQIERARQLNPLINEFYEQATAEEKELYNFIVGTYKENGIQVLREYLINQVVRRMISEVDVEFKFAEVIITEMMKEEGITSIQDIQNRVGYFLDGKKFVDERENIIYAQGKPTLKDFQKLIAEEIRLNPTSSLLIQIQQIFNSLITFEEADGNVVTAFNQDQFNILRRYFVDQTMVQKVLRFETFAELLASDSFSDFEKSRLTRLFSIAEDITLGEDTDPEIWEERFLVIKKLLKEGKFIQMLIDANKTELFKIEIQKGIVEDQETGVPIPKLQTKIERFIVTSQGKTMMVDTDANVYGTFIGEEELYDLGVFMEAAEAMGLASIVFEKIVQLFPKLRKITSVIANFESRRYFLDLLDKIFETDESLREKFKRGEEIVIELNMDSFAQGSPLGSIRKRTGFTQCKLFCSLPKGARYQDTWDWSFNLESFIPEENTEVRSRIALIEDPDFDRLEQTGGTQEVVLRAALAKGAISGNELHALSLESYDSSLQESGSDIFQKLNESIQSIQNRGFLKRLIQRVIVGIVNAVGNSSFFRNEQLRLSIQERTPSQKFSQVQQEVEARVLSLVNFISSEEFITDLFLYLIRSNKQGDFLSSIRIIEDSYFKDPENFGVSFVVEDTETGEEMILVAEDFLSFLTGIDENNKGRVNPSRLVEEFLLHEIIEQFIVAKVREEMADLVLSDLFIRDVVHQVTRTIQENLFPENYVMVRGGELRASIRRFITIKQLSESLLSNDFLLAKKIIAELQEEFREEEVIFLLQLAAKKDSEIEEDFRRVWNELLSETEQVDIEEVEELVSPIPRERIGILQQIATIMLGLWGMNPSFGSFGIGIDGRIAGEGGQTSITRDVFSEQAKTKLDEALGKDVIVDENKVVNGVMVIRKGVTLDELEDFKDSLDENKKDEKNAQEILTNLINFLKSDVGSDVAFDLMDNRLVLFLDDNYVAINENTGNMAIAQFGQAEGIDSIYLAGNQLMNFLLQDNWGALGDLFKIELNRQFKRMIMSSDERMTFAVAEELFGQNAQAKLDVIRAVIIQTLAQSIAEEMTNAIRAELGGDPYNYVERVETAADFIGRRMWQGRYIDLLQIGGQEVGEQILSEVISLVALDLENDRREIEVRKRRIEGRKEVGLAKVRTLVQELEGKIDGQAEGVFFSPLAMIAKVIRAGNIKDSENNMEIQVSIDPDLATLLEELGMGVYIDFGGNVTRDNFTVTNEVVTLLNSGDFTMGEYRQLESGLYVTFKEKDGIIRAKISASEPIAIESNQEELERYHALIEQVIREVQGKTTEANIMFTLEIFEDTDTDGIIDLYNQLVRMKNAGFGLMKQWEKDDDVIAILAKKGVTKGLQNRFTALLQDWRSNAGKEIYGIEGASTLGGVADTHKVRYRPTQDPQMRSQVLTGLRIVSLIAINGGIQGIGKDTDIGKLIIELYRRTLEEAGVELSEITSLEEVLKMPLIPIERDLVKEIEHYYRAMEVMEVMA
ncbi:hypothetical protein ACFL1T_04330 [Chlamydiota bacterium]